MTCTSGKLICASRDKSTSSAAVSRANVVSALSADVGEAAVNACRLRVRMSSV